MVVKFTLVFYPELIILENLTLSGVKAKTGINFFKGSVLPLGKMEVNSVAGLVSLTKPTSISDDRPTLADLDSEFDEKDGQGNFSVSCKFAFNLFS